MPKYATDFGSAATLTGAELVQIVQGGADKQVTAALLAALARVPTVQTVASAATVTPTFGNDLVAITAQAVALAVANPTGTAIPGLGMVIRIKDNGTARAISWGTQYRGIGVTLPSTTVASKTTYVAMIYNATDTTWDVVAVGTQA
jgi:hypothetical protein